MLVFYVVAQTQCTGTVRIIAPSVTVLFNPGDKL